MKVAFSYNGSNDPLSIEISGEMTLEDLSAYLESETGIARDNQFLYHNNRRLEGMKSTLSDLGVKDGDMILLSPGSSSIMSHQDWSNSDRMEMLRLQIMNDAQMSAQLRDTDPHLYSNLSNPQLFREAMIAKLQAQSPSFNVQNEEIRRLQQNPEDPDSQAKILEMIRHQQIEENLQLAYDISPESFVSVNMLYIKLRINGFETYALVDSGAQQTIIHPKLAEEFKILNLIDKRFAAMTLGVGTAKSEGRIHSVAVSLGDTNLEVPCSFTVVETHVGILLGLDMLRRHKCCIDLGYDALLVGDRRIKFLNESEIVKNIKSLDTFATDSLKLANDGAHQASQESLLHPVKRSTQSQNTSTEVTGEYTQKDLSQLESLGFTRQEAIAALKATSGNVELAASLLFQ